MLGGLLAFTVLHLLPGLETRFAFRDLFFPGHPAREAYDEFEENFDLGSRIVLYFHGQGVFAPPFLERATELAHELRRIDGTRGVLAAADLVEPKLEKRYQVLSRILRPEVLEEPEQLTARLRRAPFTTHFRGLLYDEALETYCLVVTPPLDDSDPRANRAYMGEVLGLAEAAARETSTELYAGGYRFLHHEVRRVGMESQLRLTRLAFVLQILLFWLLFRSLVVAAQMLALLAASVLLGYGAMAAMGLPVTFLSINLAIMVLVIGTADLVHIVGSYVEYRRVHGPTGAALRAARRTGIPVLLTSLTTAGCLLVTSATPLDQLRQFSLALAAGVMVTWAVAVVYGPLLFRRSGLRPGGGLYVELSDTLSRALEGAGHRLFTSPWVGRAFVVLALAAGWNIARQKVDSNWFRYFGAGTPVARTLDFLERRAFPLTAVDLTLDVDLSLLEAFEDRALARDVGRIEALLRRQRGVLDVDHVYRRHGLVRALVERAVFPPEIHPDWHASRRQALVRQFIATGVYDRYFSTRVGQLRIVAHTELEGSAELQALREELEREVTRLELETVRPADLRITGQMHYWSAIVREIPRTFLRNVLGCVAVVALFFLLLTGSPALTAVALVPNVLPVLVMFGLGRLAGIPVNENLCFVVSLSIGIAVDDTLHFLYHYLAARGRGRSREEAVQEGFVVAGAPIVVTSILLMGGFGLCLSSSVLPIWQMGVLLLLAIATALFADLLLVPSLLLRMDEGPAPGEDRGYELVRAPLPRWA